MNKTNKRLKICLVCSAGGHLNQIMALSAFYSIHDYYIVTFYCGSIKNLKEDEKVYFTKDPSRKVASLVLNAFQSVKIFFKEKPDVVISTGAGVAVVTCFLGWMFRKKVIFIEDWCRINKPSLSGRLIYPLADLFFVQWETLLRFYPKAVCKGSLI